MTWVLPHRTIKIDGKLEDWNGLEAAFLSGTRSPESRNLEIDKVYLTVDDSNLYMRFDISDDTPSSFFHSSNFNTTYNTNYALDLSNAQREVEVHCQFHKNQSAWRTEIFKRANGGTWSLSRRPIPIP